MAVQKFAENVLVVLVKDRADHAILHQQLWYRIPVDSAPNIVKQGKVKYMGFYLPSKFGDEQKWKIHHYGKVKRITEATRQELFPKEPLGSSKANKRYFKIELEMVEALTQPIVSHRGHRLLFVPTTEQKFFQARNLNSLFNASPLEDLLFEKLEALNIPSERQWLVEYGEKRKYWLDFAIFCNDGAVDVECDGDRYHLAPDQVKYDKGRNNELTSLGWSVLRFSTDELTNKINYVMEKIVDTINQREGPIGIGYLTIPRLSKNGQLGLFN
jgi:very-short-patch-repair endonuclease